MYRDEYPFEVTQQEAIARLRALTDYWDAEYKTRTTWEGATGTICGRVFGISFWARFVVDPGLLHGQMKVSFIAERMGGRKYLKRKLDHYLDPAVSLEELQALVPQPSVA